MNTSSTTRKCRLNKLHGLKKRRALVGILVVSLVLNVMFSLAPRESSAPMVGAANSVIQAAAVVDHAHALRFLPGAFR
jgi:hypothetical protein